MIISARFVNILSFKEETKILFTAGKSDKLPAHVTRAQKRDDISVLHAGLIYGANASGKSNIVKCLSILRDMATIGWPQMPYETFKMTTDQSGISELEIEFKQGENYFAYGVAFSKQELLEEWLYKIGSRTDTLIFARNQSDGQWENKFAPTIATGEQGQFLRFLAEGTPAQSTFLSDYIARNGKGIPEIREARKWFDNLHIIFPSTRSRDFAVRVVNDDAFRVSMRSLLRYFDTGITDLRRIQVQVEELHLPDEVRKEVEENLAPIQKKMGVTLFDGKRFIYAELNEQRMVCWFELKAIHRMSDGTERIFEIREESDGTVRLLDFIPMLIDMHTNDAVYVIDEVDRSLHPNLTLKLLELFDDMLKAGRDMQLICTTHESNLLSEAPIRQDEVWFVQKEKGASRLISLCEYKPRENVQKGYLLGRYGAIPFFGLLDNIHWESHEEEQQ